MSGARFYKRDRRKARLASIITRPFPGHGTDRGRAGGGRAPESPGVTPLEPVCYGASPASGGMMGHATAELEAIGARERRLP